MEFTKEEKEVIKKIIDKMCELELFRGCYDAKNGNPSFMHGIGFTMEYLAFFISEEYGNQFGNMFTKNMVESKKNS